MLIIFLPSLHYPFFLHYSSPIFPPHTSTRSNVFVQSNHLLSNSKHISLTIFSLQHVTVSLPLFTLGLSYYPLRPTCLLPACKPPCPLPSQISSITRTLFSYP